MKLKKVQITDFRSVWDTGEFEIADITCLVGKNEAGKTAVLKALHRLHPLEESGEVFSVTDDFPRSMVSDYEADVKSGKRTAAHVIVAKFELSDAEKELVEEEFGQGFLKSSVLTLKRGYYTTTWVTLEVDEGVAVRHLVDRAEMPGAQADEFKQAATLKALLEAIGEAEEDEHSKRLSVLAEEVKAAKGFMMAAYNRHLDARVPKFLYFDEFYQMRGHENIEALKQRLANSQLKRSDHPLLGLVEIANLTLDDLLNPTRTLDLKTRLEGAGNKLSRTILKYWSQNKHIHMRFDVRPGKAADPEGMREGTNLWAEVYDSKHLATTLVGERSRGFVWFFSFLAWYAQQQGKSQSIILLLDEPGLTLHGTAQGDLLRYIEKELGPNHQVIYTTHSPFMVDPQHWDRVRIVQDRGMEQDDLPQDQDGTKVFTDVLEASEGSLFPLQGALGYEIHQTLFVGPNTLIVEGASDLLYIQTVTGVLQRAGRVGLDARWTITPVGGSDKVPTFVALLGAQKNMTLATLIDIQSKDQQMIENLYKRKLLDKQNVLTFADFTAGKEADIEDMFGDVFYVSLVNGEFGSSINASALPAGAPRVLVRLQVHIDANPLPGGARFNHYRPSRYFAEKIGALTIPADALDRFEEAFKRLNAVLPA